MKLVRLLMKAAKRLLNQFGGEHFCKIQAGPNWGQNWRDV
jgi:hypothetical protein